MRRGALLIACALAQLPAAAAAQPVAAPVAAPGQQGQVELRITATGEVSTPADILTVALPISANGETSAAARSAAKKRIETIIAALVARGIDRSAITVTRPDPGYAGFLGMEEQPAGEVGPADPSGVGKMIALSQRKIASSGIRIRLSDPALASRLPDILDELDQPMAGAPRPELLDERKARDAAIANARREAEAYAQPLGLKLAGIRRVSNFGAPDAALDQDDLIARMAGFAGNGATDRVTTRVRVWVDFVLEPR